MIFRKTFPYLLSAVFLFSWWGFAFTSSTQKKHSLNLQKKLSFSKEKLHLSLQGDVLSMQTLLIQWKEGLLKNFPPCSDAINLSNQILSGTYKETWQKDQIIDDAGNSITTPLQGPFLPQTQLAASILLALLDEKEITAIPSGIREQKKLYCAKKIDAIALDTDRHCSEIIFSKKPKTAFVACYSNPSTLETLRKQGIKLIFLDNLSSIENCIENIRRMGHFTGNPAKGELLALFIICTLEVLDTEIALLKQARPLKTFYLNFSNHITTPTEKSLQGLLLKRIGYLWPEAAKSTNWNMPLDQEDIWLQKPELLIIATMSKNPIDLFVKNFPFLKNTPAYQHGNIFFLDESLQSCPCQMIALGYYDICQAIASGEG